MKKTLHYILKESNYDDNLSEFLDKICFKTKEKRTII